MSRNDKLSSENMWLSMVWPKSRSFFSNVMGVFKYWVVAVDNTATEAVLVFFGFERVARALLLDSLF